MPEEIETKEIKQIDMELKAVGDDGVFAGYASFFGNVTRPPRSSPNVKLIKTIW